MKNEKNRISIREYRTLYTNNPKTGRDEAYHSAVQEIRNIQGLLQDSCFRGDVGVGVRFRNKKTADSDNILKGIIDALQGVLFENDKQVIANICFCDDINGRRMNHRLRQEVIKDH